MRLLKIPNAYLKNDMKEPLFILLCFLRSSEKEGNDDSWHTSEEEELDFTPKVWCLYRKIVL